MYDILCDFDGTIAIDDVTDLVLERFALPQWQAIETEWRNGRLSSRQCMNQQVALLNMSIDELNDVIDNIRIDPAFPDFIRIVRQLSWSIRIVSDGLDYAIRRILARYGLSFLPIYANHLVSTGTTTWRLDSPWATSTCCNDSGTCKCALIAPMTANRRTLLIGDGASDFCIAEHVDFVFAKHRLIEHCKIKLIPHISVTGFDDVNRLLSTLNTECSFANLR